MDFFPDCAVNTCEIAIPVSAHGLLWNGICLWILWRGYEGQLGLGSCCDESSTGERGHCDWQRDGIVGDTKLRDILIYDNLCILYVWSTLYPSISGYVDINSSTSEHPHILAHREKTTRASINCIQKLCEACFPLFQEGISEHRTRINALQLSDKAKKNNMWMINTCTHRIFWICNLFWKDHSAAWSITEIL